MASKEVLVMKQLIIASDKTMYDLTIEHHGDGSLMEVKLNRSPLYKGWTNPGQECLKLSDNGNDVTVKVGKKSLKMDYGEVNELMIVLKEYFAEQSHSRITYKKFVEESS